ncbi:uncharacterized protein N0V89_010629 [Didymosphaeria variabile]|uniref:Ubiquitin-like protease family profile domain-containing protein n=1 Tax=Didymosphaeria variabile TaxID=1932322 RepID=A0A9W8XD97_9PLEO|nr:uncharacterized protein N0V89_010629 [Didymosphaeria variabile]KAJ4346697.1 hypothetical protein N0V89_010629 [Didymosphaeria variabile]
MPKPGATFAPQPKNTLSQPTYHPGSAHKTYGRPARTNYSNLDFLEEERFSAETRPTKKRRTENEQPHAISVYDDGDVEEIRPGTQTSRPASRRSAGSGSFSLPGPKDSRSEFERASAIADPRRKKGRTSASQGHSGIINGNAQSSAITVDDDDIPDYNAPRKLQLQKFQQGIEGVRDTASQQRIPQTTSKHFAPKMNHSTNPLTQRAVRKPDNLRNKFTRAPLPGSSARGDMAEILPWPLRWTRAHDFNGNGQDLFLNSKVLNEYRITSSDPNDMKYEISLKKVVSAQSDHTSRIRLTGSTDAAGVQYMVDLQFENQEDLAAFETALGNSITMKSLTMKSRDFMKTIFQKPLAVTSTSPNASLPPRGRDEVVQVSNVMERPRLLDNLAPGYSDPTSQKSFTSVRVPTQHEIQQRTSGRPMRSTRATQAHAVDSGDFEDEPEVERYSQIHGLGPPWKKQLNYGSGRRRAVVDFADLERLDNGQFLNDQLIDFYLLYLFDQMKVPREKVYVFNTHFFTTLTRKVPGHKGLINYQGVARWTSKEDIFSYDYIVVPINQDIHWYLAIICNVSNIARTPAIEDLTKSDGVASSGILNEPSRESAAHDLKAGDLQSMPPPALVDASSEPWAPRAANEVVDPDDSDLNIVDPRATGHDPGRHAPSGSSSVAESPAAETAQLNKLSLNDSKPEGILLSSSSFLSPKKPKRRLGPPLKKWDLNQPVIVVLDSLGGGAKSPAVRVLKEYMIAEGHEKRGMEAKISQNAYYAKESQIPQQQNFSDCGVYLLGYAQKFFENPDVFKNRLLSGEMHVETDWPDMAMPDMRAAMRDILQKLNTEQEAERQQAKQQMKQNKKNGTMGAAVNATKNNVKQNPTVAEKEGNANDRLDVQEATTNPERTITPGEEKPPSLSSTQPQPGLGSPFQPQRPKKRDSSPSLSLPTPTKTDAVSEVKRKETPPTSDRQASPIIAVPRKSRSPIVLIPSPVRKSPKRSRRETVVGDRPDETIRKKLRIEPNPVKNFLEGEPRIVGIRSPDPKAESLPKQFSKTSTLAPPRGDFLPAKGSSRDPIPLDDSQETQVLATEAIPHSTKRSSQGPDFIVTTPKSAKGPRLPPKRQHQQHMSSPAKVNVERSSPVRRRETRSANHSPDVIDDPQAHPQRFQAQSSPAYRNYPPARSRFRAKTQEDDIPEKTIEVPETPPHDP